MIKNFVFDMGNVIIKWNPEYIVSQYTKDIKEQELLVKEVFKSQEWLDYDAGTMDMLEVQTKICTRLPQRYHAMVFDMIAHWYRYCPAIEEMVPIIRCLKEKGYGIYLLSNTNPSFHEYQDTIDAFTYFDGFYISALHKRIKPKVETFKHFAGTFSLSLEECIFIDDVEENIEGARQAGMQGYYFDGNIETFKEYLKKESF